MENYIPDIYVKDIFNINFEELKSRGIKCLLFDLDNTLVPAKSINMEEKYVNKIKDLKNDFDVILFSNCLRKRGEMFLNLLDIEGVLFARKPSSKNYNKLLEDKKYKLEEVAMIGDQLLTDIKGGNKVGIVTILVDPISSDGIFTKFNRIREKSVFTKLSDKGLLYKGRYYEM